MSIVDQAEKIFDAHSAIVGDSKEKIDKRIELYVEFMKLRATESKSLGFNIDFDLIEAEARVHALNQEVGLLLPNAFSFVIDGMTLADAQPDSRSRNLSKTDLFEHYSALLVDAAKTLLAMKHASAEEAQMRAQTYAERQSEMAITQLRERLSNS